MITLSTLVGMVMLLAASLYFEPVQTYAAKKTAAWLSHKADAQIDLERVYFKPFSQIELNKFSILDSQKDTLLYADVFLAKIDLKQILLNRVIIEKITSSNSVLHYQIFEDSTNFDFLDKLFPAPTEKTGKKNSLQIKLNALELKNNRFTLVNHNFNHHDRGVDFSDLDLRGIDIRLDKIKWTEDSLSAQVETLNFIEKSGFHLKKFESDLIISDTKMEFTDLFFETNSSQYSDYLKFEYEDFKSGFKDFIHNIDIYAEIKDSYVDSEDIEFFSDNMKHVQFKTHINEAIFQGRVDNFKVQNLRLQTQEEAIFDGNISVTGLPDINNTLFLAEINTLKSSVLGIESLVKGLADNPDFSLPEELHRFHTVAFKGQYTGKYNDFQIVGDAETERGEVHSDVHIQIANLVSYQGNIRSKDFEVGSFIGTEALDIMSFDLEVDGQGLLLEDLELKTKGEISSLSTEKLSLHDTQIDVDLMHYQAAVQAVFRDEKIKGEATALLDFEDFNNLRYDVDGTIDYADLKAAGLVKTDPVAIVRTPFELHLNGNSLNHLDGTIEADLSFQKFQKEFDLKNVRLTLFSTETGQKYDLQSAPLDLTMEGDIDFASLEDYFTSLAVRYAPAIGLTPRPFTPQNFTLDVHIKEFDLLAPLFSQEIQLANDARLYAHFSSDTHVARMTAFSPFLYYKGIKAEEIEIAENADEKDFFVILTADKIQLSDSLYVNDVSVYNTLVNDSLQFTLRMGDSQAENHLDINGHALFEANKPAYIQIENSVFRANKDEWKIEEGTQMYLSKGKLYVDHLIFKQDKQQIGINGVFSNSEEDDVFFTFKDFNLASLDAFTQPLNFDLKGNLNGNLQINSIFKNPSYSTSLHTSSILYNSRPIGKLELQAQLSHESNKADIQFHLLDGQRKGISAKGYYLLGESSGLHLHGETQELELFILQPFLKELVSGMEGKINSRFEMEGNLQKPVFRGQAEVMNAGFTVNYLQVPYVINKQQLLINNNKIHLQDFVFKDTKGNSGIAKGTVDLNNLLDVGLDIDLTAHNLLMLNTTFKDNNLYYGTAYGSGKVQFRGTASAVNMNMQATSNAQTKITLPFNASSTLENEDFISFKTPDHEEKNKRVSFQGMTMRLDLNFTPEAEVSIHTDMGELFGNGNGEISMLISSLGDFEMFGDYVVSQGTFHFTAQDLFNKYFEIEEGAALRWTGNPTEAIINMKAIYQQRTSVSPLYNAAGQSPNDQRVQARADMILKGNLSRPDISFDLTFPQDPYIKDELQGYLSDVNNVNQQALSLIVRRSFTPSSTEEFGREINNTLLSAGTEIAFNQLNTILSQSLNMDFFDLNIRSLNDASASIRFFDDRLIITGGIADYRNQQINDLMIFSDRVATDAELIYKLRKDGNFIFRANNKLNTRNFLLNPHDEYISAVGLVYRQEFNTLGEFWRKLWMRKPARQEEEFEVLASDPDEEN